MPEPYRFPTSLSPTDDLSAHVVPPYGRPLAATRPVRLIRDIPLLRPVRATDTNSVPSTKPTPLDMPDMLARPDGSNMEPANNVTPTFFFGEIRDAIMRRRARARSPDVV